MTRPNISSASFISPHSGQMNLPSDLMNLWSSERDEMVEEGSIGSSSSSSRWDLDWIQLGLVGGMWIVDEVMEQVTASEVLVILFIGFAKKNP